MHSLLLPFAALAATAPVPASYEGVWQGTLGDQPVRACFTNREWGPFGAYYYLSHLKLIALETPEKGSAAYREGSDADAKGPEWIVDTVAGAELLGRWVGGGRTLPIRLKRLAAPAGDETPCASGLFHAPRLSGLGTSSRRATKDGVGYTIRSLDTRGRFEATVETFQLDGAGAAVARINSALRKPLSDEASEWLECVRGALDSRPAEGGYDDRHEPSMISSRWLAVTHHWDVYCGGAYPDAGYDYRTFDRATGAEVDLHDWLTAAAVKRERFEGEPDIKTLRPAFVRVILKGWKPDQADCAEAVTSQEYWTIGLTRTGLLFTPLLAHVVQACGEDFAIPFARLRPFLTPEGAKNVRALPPR